MCTKAVFPDFKETERRGVRKDFKETDLVHSV